MSSPSKLTLSMLRDAVGGGAVAIRAINKLMPAGGATDKVFPPTYMKERERTTKYALETRKVDGRDVETVLLDSIASQANRIEEALLEGWRRGELSFPVISIDFRGIPELADLDEITSLQAPHRVADALLRDSIDEQGTPFRQTTVGRACIVEAGGVTMPTPSTPSSSRLPAFAGCGSRCVPMAARSHLATAPTSRRRPAPYSPRSPSQGSEDEAVA